MELTEITAEGKIKPTGKTLKVQIKSTQSDGSYIQRETPESFFFYASEADIEYWNSYRQFGYQVLLVVFDGRSGQEFLYCKQITDIDVALTKTKGKQKSQPIEFSKTENRLVVGDNNFVSRYQASFVSRVNFTQIETLDSNIWPFTSTPRMLYKYPTHFKTKGDVFHKLKQGEDPYFILYNSEIFTFVPIETAFQKFFEHVVSEGQKRTVYPYREVTESVVLRNHYVELLNVYIRDFMRSRSLHYQRHFRRYYFYLKEEQTEYKVPFRTRKINKQTEKTVAKEYTYGPNHFFRHLAVEVKPLFVEEKVYLVVSPKYFFSSNRKDPWDPKKITQYTNYLNAQTYNDGVLDELHFWWQHLAKGGRDIAIFDGTTVNQTSITVGSSLWFPVKFAPPLDGPKVAKKKSTPSATVIAPTLFDLLP